ncbi:MAG: universal stress protein, partial [Pseudomonadota bacterium]
YWMKTLVFGTITGALYAAVFTYFETIIHYFTKGGIYTLLPVAAFLVFFYMHGSFFSNFWSALKIEGSNIAVVKKADEESQSVDKRSDTKPWAQTGA